MKLDDHVYRRGFKRLEALIHIYQPKVLIFSYKNALDSLLEAKLNKEVKTRYGFNPEYENIFGAAVFVFPMIGTPCTRDEAITCMNDLTTFLDIKPS